LGFKKITTEELTETASELQDTGAMTNIQK
jgi:hypothetical protein